ALALASVTTALATAAPKPAIKLGRIAGQRGRPGYAETVRVGQVVAVSGRAAHAPAVAGVALQARISGAWHTLLTGLLRHDRFALRWHVRTRAFQLRAVLLSGRRRIATSAVAQVLVG